MKPEHHRFVPGDPANGWQDQCAQRVGHGDQRSHCGYPESAHDPDAPIVSNLSQMEIDAMFRDMPKLRKA